MILRAGSFPAEADVASGVIGGGVYCATVNGQCAPVGAFTVDALSPATGIVTQVTPFGARVLQLDCVDIAHAPEGNSQATNSLSATGLDVDGERWWVLAQQFADGRIFFSTWQQEPDVGVCGFGDGLIIGPPARGRFAFVRQ